MLSFNTKKIRLGLRSKVTRVVVAGLLGSLLVPVVGISAPQILSTADANNPNPGSLVVTSNGNNYSPGGYGNNFVSLALPTGKEISEASAYTVEAWIKSDLATNPASIVASFGFGPTEYSRVDGWNQRANGGFVSVTPKRGSYYHFNNNETVGYRCDTEDKIAAECPYVEVPRGQWVHMAFQKSDVSTGTDRIIAFINGVPTGQRTVTNSNAATMLKYFMIGPFANNNSSKVSFSQMRVTAGSLYPTDGTTTFKPSYDFSDAVSGSTVSSGATVVALFKPQTNSTTANLVDLSPNGGTTVKTFVPTTNVVSSTDYAAPPAPAFTYSPASVSTFTGSSLPTATPVLTGGDINSYSVNPALPNGLNLNTTTGVISGTPTVFSPTATYVVTGTQNGSGLQTTANVSITVNKPNTTVSITLFNSAVQVGVIDTITATASVAGNVSFQTDLGIIPECQSIPTTTVSPYIANCPWNPASSYYTMNATLTPSSSELAPSTSAPSLTNIRGSLRLTSTGTTTYPSGGQFLTTNNTLRLNFPSGTGLVSSQSFTIETWVKVDNPILKVDINAFYGNDFYGDRGQGADIFNDNTEIYNFMAGSVVGRVTPTTPIAANNSWQNLVFQRKYVPGNAEQSFDAYFINGVLVAQFANGVSMQAKQGDTTKSRGVRIGPFNGEAQIGPTQILSGVAAYPLTGFSPSTTYSFGANTLALFQPSPTSCNSASVAPTTVTATYDTSNFACSTQFPVALPRVNSVEANRGPIAGQNVVKISGNNFVNVTSVKFGATAVALEDYSINTFGSEITAKVPAGALGDVFVSVMTAAGISPSIDGSKYTYLPLPTITNLSPSVGDSVGNNSVVITGTNFTNASAVRFGSTNATSFTVNSPTRITAISPTGTGAVNVKVTAPGGTTSDTTSTFTYNAGTSVSSITPNTGSTGGYTTVEITGTNFTGATAVKFGTQNATSFTVVNSTKITAVSPSAAAATVGITVVVGGTEYTLASAFTYTATVAVTAISPIFGPATGGTVVEISGTNFSSASTVVFGATAATDVSYNGGTGKITATSPAGTGAVDIRVTTGVSTSANVAADNFTYFAAPTITGLSRLTGPNSGGSTVIITGTNFTGASTVAFGANNVATFTVNSLTQITATSPAGTGTVDVRVTNQGGRTENVSADDFTYFPLPAVTTISPSSGTTGGGTAVTITGENFTGATTVKFGTTDATFTVNSATEITATTPAGTGEVNVTVITPGGTSAAALYGRFTYVSPPTITLIAPASGMITGGQDVVITGTGLDNLLATGGVLFGSVAAQTVSVISSTQIRAVSPVTTVLGPVDIFLVNASGPSVASAASVFTYTKSNDAKLSTLTISQGALLPVFSSTTISYTASVINSVDKVTVTPTINQINATIQVKIGSSSFESVASGTASLDLALAVGVNEISVKVTAQDDSVNTYTINLTRLSNIATLSGATIKGPGATIGTAGTTLGSLVAGTITLTTAQALGSAATTFTKSDAGAAINKIVKLSSGTAESQTNFDAATDLVNGSTGTVTHGDYFIIKVTAADGTINYSRINLTVNSDVATLSGATIKGEIATLGTSNAVLASVVAGAITLTTAQASSTATTTFTRTDSNSTISKIVRYASGASTTSFDSDTAFSSGSGSSVSNSDFFIIKITAADATIKYTRINVTVNSNVATLSGATIKGLPSTVGTPGTALGSLSAGTITLTVTQGTSTTALTTFTKTDAGATITKIAKLASGTAENLTNFNAAQAFTNGSTDTVSNGDYFLIQVTAADQTVNYSRVNIVFATNPTVPQTLAATAQAGGASLTWSAPTSNGGSALTGYVIEASTDSITWISVGTTNQSTAQLSVTNLSNGTAYVYRVRATNSSGDLNYNWATSASVRSFYYVACSISGSFYVNPATSPVQILSASGVNCMGEVTIPQGIQQININAFTQNTETSNRNITKVTFPSTGLRTIDQGAFKNLGLTSISIPASVETVGIYSFMNNYLTTIFVAGTGVGLHPTALLNSAFAGNGTPGPVLTLGSGKIQIGQNFGTGTSFSNVVWGTGLRTIESRAFYNVSASSWAPLFPSTITSFESQAFEGTGIRTIRFGSATTHAVTSINQTAFDPSITSVQYCGQSGTLLSNYINSRFTTKTIWCAEVVPNAPTGLTAAAGASGQVLLNWARGASLNEAPTEGFEIRYSSDGGSTWSTLIQVAAAASSFTVPNLSNGTNYIFQVRAKNLFGESTYSANASATPLGTRTNPEFGPSTSTVDGFTVNVINYDATYTYSVPQFTVGSGSISVGIAIGNNLPIMVTGMTPGSVATISIENQKPGFSNGSGIASGSALNAAKVPVIGNIVTLTGGFTAVVTNYDAAYQWNVSSTLGTAVINTQGGVTVSGVAPLTPVELTVSTTRAGYAPGSTKVTVTTLALLKVFYNGTRATGGAVPTDSNSYASNTSAIVLANPVSGGLTLNGYSFSGWSLNSDESGQIYQSGSSLALGLVNITLYSKWTLTQYAVSYNSNGATDGAVPFDSNTYTMGGSVPILGNTGTLVRTGYSFIGWGISSTDTTNLYVSGNSYTVGTSNIAFWARWSPSTYRVTFDANGGTGAPSKAYDDYTTAGAAISLATVGTLQKSGYNFAGWGLSAISTPVADQFTTVSNVDLYAQWTAASYSVTYLLGTYGGGTLPTQANVTYGASFTVAASTGLTGSDGTDPFAFVSWSDGAKTYAPGQSLLMGAGVVELTAQWTKIYNVKYSFNGGRVTTPIGDQQKIAGQSILVSSVVPERAGYEFVSWKDQSGEVATAGSTYVVRDNHYLLYAQWTAKPLTITYDVNGGNSVPPTQANRTIGQIFTVAAAPSKTGYDFEHWFDGTKNYNSGSDYEVATNNVVLQAIWTPKVYQISYNFNGGTGTPIAAQNYTFDTGPANLPGSGPTRNEHNFMGWATTTTATTGVFTFTPSGNILLHAVWVSSVYRLTFNAGSGISDTATATVTIGQSTTLPSATRANYTLQGWSIAPTGGTVLLTTSPYTPTTDATLYAQWVAQLFTITYNGNNGTAARTSDSAAYNTQTPIVLPSATRENYVFSGWYSEATGGYLIGESGANYLPTASITAFARWVQASLSGMGPATLIAQITVRDGIDTGFTAGSNGSTATVAYTAGALPDGTVITAYLENSPVRVTSLLQTAASPVLSLIIAWVSPDGTVRDTAPGKPIVMTVTNSTITAGSKIFGLVGNQPEVLGIALIDGQVQVSITKDPAVVVAMVAPDAPTGVTATPIDSTSATISWTASVNNGGSAITKYVATAGAGKSCESLSATTCVIDGLVAGTPYTFTVIASNAIGNSASSAPSLPLTLNAPSSGNTGGGSGGGSSGGSGGGSSGGSSGGASAPSLPVADVSTPATVEKAAAEKAAADAKAAAGLKAAVEKAAAEAAAAAALKAAQEIADAEARAAAQLKAAQDKATEDTRIASELKAAQEKADAELKAAAEKKALDDAKAAAVLAAKKIVPKITLYSISSKLTLSAYDNAYLKKYISTLKPKAPVTCIGYYYTKNTTVAKAKALATTQAKAICSMIKKAKPSVITAIALYSSTKAPLAAKGAKWVAVSYRVDSFKGK